MLSKQIKIRIASNKHFRRVPKWRRSMRTYFLMLLSVNTSMYNSARSMLGAAGASYRSRLMEERTTIEELSTTWTRKDWYANRTEALAQLNVIMRRNRDRIYGRILEQHPYAKPLVAATDEFFAQRTAEAINDFTGDTIVLNQKLRDQQGEHDE